MYYRTRIKDADDKVKALQADTAEELYEKEMKFRAEVEDILFRRANPTVAEYCEKWLAIKSATLSDVTLRWYSNVIKNHIVEQVGDRYL